VVPGAGAIDEAAVAQAAAAAAQASRR